MTHRISSVTGLFRYLFGGGTDERPACGAEPDGSISNTTSDGINIALSDELRRKIRKHLTDTLDKRNGSSELPWIVALRSTNTEHYLARLSAAHVAQAVIVQWWRLRNPNKSPAVIKIWNAELDCFDIIYIPPKYVDNAYAVYKMLRYELERQSWVLVGDNRFARVSSAKQFARVVQDITGVKQDILDPLLAKYLHE